MARPASLLLVTGIAAASLAAGCGGSDDETPATITWADGVCSTFTTWTKAIGTAADSVTEQGSEDPLVTRVDTAVGEVRAATNTLADDLESLGSPDTEAGEEAKDQLGTLSDDLVQDVEAIEDAANDVSGASAALDAVSTISATIATMGERVSATLDELKQLDATGELADAFEQADSCASLRQ